ncbi:MAG: hypothetical protein HOW73_17410 [Polyangiaceae bacterium]|nr:hypothetical protein [Polyangiaceae bacterium]
MHAHRATACLLVVLTALAACSAPPPPRTDVPETAGTSDANAGGDLAPVPAPAGLVAKGRAKSLGASLRVVESLVGAPAGTVEGAGRGAITQLLARGLRLEIDPSFGQQLAIDAPIDFAVAAAEGTDVNIAFSVGLASLDQAKAAAGPNLAEVGPGVWALGGEKAKASCAIMQAAGAAPARLVCGPREADVTALGPYLVRTLSVEAPPAQDLVADIDVVALNARFGSIARKLIPSAPMIAARQWGTGNPTYDKALEEIVRFFANDAGLLLEDMKSVRLEGTIDQAKGISFKLRADLSGGSKSWFARTALSGASSRVPDQLWKGPSDASGAVFGTVVDPASFGDVTKAVKGMLLGGLESAKVGSDAERKKVADLVDLPIAKGTSFVAMGGFGRVTKPTDAKSAKDKQQRHFDRLMGWYLIGTNQKADAWAKWMKDAAAAFNQAGVQKALKKELGKDDSVSLSTSAAPKELGKGAVQLNVAFTSKVEKETAAGTLLVLLMPDGDSSWIAMGFDRAELVERLLRAKEGKGSLKERTELALLNQAGTNGGAFATLQSFRSSVYAMMLMRAAYDKNAKPDDVASEALRATDEVFASLPRKGLAPMFVRTSVQNNVASVDIDLGKPVLDDASALVKLFQPQKR